MLVQYYTYPTTASCISYPEQFMKASAHLDYCNRLSTTNLHYLTTNAPGCISKQKCLSIVICITEAFKMLQFHCNNVLFPCDSQICRSVPRYEKKKKTSFKTCGCHNYTKHLLVLWTNLHHAALLYSCYTSQTLSSTATPSSAKIIHTVKSHLWHISLLRSLITKATLLRYPMLGWQSVAFMKKLA